MTERTALRRDRKHDHFWIDDGDLYESYKTSRGLRWRHHMSVPEMPDSDRCSAEEIHRIESHFIINEQPCGCHDDPIFGHVVMAGCRLHD